jgi:hypothetical protein
MSFVKGRKFSFLPVFRGVVNAYNGHSLFVQRNSGFIA